MSLGIYNPTECAPFVAGRSVKAFQTEQAAADQWHMGRLAGVVATRRPGPGAAGGRAVGTLYVVALDAAITAAGLGGRTCAASPEQRDVLAEMVGDARPSDLKLLTQQQYLEDPACVDVYVTAVNSPSPFLAALPRPVHLREVPGASASFPADAYATTYNLDPVGAAPVDLRLWT